MSLVDFLIIFLQESLFFRAYLKFSNEGFMAGLISIKRKLKNKNINKNNF
jgi:hypothetical protein